MANSPARSAVDVGSVIAGTYTIEALIGHGGMGVVFLASHNRLRGKHVAIKLLHAELRDDEVLARFKREAQIATQLDHPNIVEVHDFNITDDGTPYLVLEYLQGEPLNQRLRQGALPVEQVLSIARQVGSALAAAHRGGIVHRDLKPANIFLVPSEVDGRAVEIAKILDFGISKMLHSSTVKTQDSTLLGTPAYMAPEQAKGEHAAVDGRTDVFALGAILYEMLAGHPPFAGASIPEVVFKVVYEPPLPLASRAPYAPINVVAAVERAMAKAQADRFASVSDFVEALTGQPLVTTQRAAAVALPDRSSPSSPSGKVKSTSSDAYEPTMHSGDGSRPMPVAPFGATLPSKPEIALPTDGMVRTVPSAVPNTPPAPRRKRSPLVLVIVAIAVAAVTIAIIFAVSGPGPAPREPVVAAPADAAPIALADAAAPPVALADALAPADAAAVIAIADAGTPKPPPDASIVATMSGRRQTPPPPPPVDNEGEDTTFGATLRQAEGALRARNFDAASRAARSIINAHGDARPTPQQYARAYAVDGAVQCLRDSSLEGARIALAQIPRRFARLRAMLVSACHDVGSL